MPNPIRPNPTRPGSVTGPGATTPAAPSAPATPVAPTLGPADRFVTTSGTGPAAPARLAAPVALGDFDGQALSIGRDGRLTMPGDQGTLDDTLKINRLALANVATTNPFAQVTDKVALLEASTRLATQHQAGLMDPSGDKQTLDFRAARAGSLALLQQAAERAGQLGDAGLQKQILDQLTRAVRNEPFRALKDFAWDSLVTGAADGRLPDVKEAKEAIYPSKPPREQWLKDGKLKVAYYIDNDGSELGYQLGFMRSLGLREKKIDDQNYVFTRDARGGQPAIEVLFKSPKTHDDKPKLLEKIDDPTVDIIAYTGHAGYGHRVDHAIGQGASGTGDGKLVVLMQCWGEGNVESLERAFPDAQVLSTTEPSTDNHDQLMFRAVLNGVLQDKDWGTMQTEVVSGMRRMMFLGDASPEKHFFFPNTREVLGGKYDRDKDGVRDPGDKVFNVIYPKRLDAAGGFDPVAQAIADDALDGSHLNKATSNLSLVMRYNALLEPAQAAKVKWSPEAPQPAGFFTPADGDLRAFRFSLDAQSGKLNVALSTRFAHTDGKDLSRMLAYESGLFLGKEAGLDAKGQVALALTMLERSAHQQDGWYYANNLTDEPWAEETLLVKRYGLDNVSFEDISAAMGHADDLNATHVGMVKDLVARQGLEAVATKAPQRVGEPLPVPANLRLGASSLDASAVARVLRELGVQGTVESFGPSWMSSGEPNNIVAVVRDPAGRTQQVGLSVDNEGFVQAAARIPLEVDKVKVRSGHAYMAAFAKATGLDAAKLQQGFDAAVGQGKGVAEAVAETIAKERANVKLGTEVPRLEAFDKLRSYGLATAGEHGVIQDVLARVYPTGEALDAERAALEWVDGLAGGQKDALRAAWLSALASDGTRLGAGKALVGALNALPAPPAGSAPFPLKQVLQSGLVAPGAQADVVRALRAKTGQSEAAFAKQYADTLAPSWLDTATRDALAARVDAVVSANGPAKDVLIAYAEVLKGGNQKVPAFDLALLEDAGVLEAADARAVADRLRALQ